MFLKLTSFVGRNTEISTFLATNPFNKLIRRSMEISIFLATIPFKKLRRRIFMFLKLTNFLARNVKISTFLATKLVKRNMVTFNQICLKISTFYFFRKNMLKILIFLTECSIFGKEEFFEAFQLQKTIMVLVILLSR